MMEDLIRLYQNTPGCLSRGEFTLASGIRSSYYIDSKTVTLTSHGLRLIISYLLDKITTECPGVEAIGGMTLGADPIVSACIAAQRLRDSMVGFLVRKASKSHGSKKRIEGPLEKRHNVVLVEDVTTTGETLLDTMRVVMEEKEIPKQQILGAFTVVDRGYGARDRLAQQGIRLHSLLTANSLGIDEARE